ncbi:ketopantoate reductase family protein [Pseudomonas huanghezhanensis]|uniref:ketopantoate reductase family protein n=1 Tax=Pseudomonas huanghezhanensis TaxID=3002903 RepID=UPI0022868850|nr:2-dehydropantoate 2-reductase [Pseudomonas sp. BSw22131]
MNSSSLRVCVAGAGAIGCTLAARIALSGQPVSVFARGKTLAALQRNGIHLHDLEGRHHVTVNASDDAAALGVQDVVFLCTKAPSLTTLLPQIQPLIGPDTRVIPMVNGVPWWYFHGEGGRFDGEPITSVDPDGVIHASLDPRNVIGCVVFMTAQSSGPGVVSTHNAYRIVFGELNNALTPRLEELCSLIARAGIETQGSDRIRDQLWTKIIANLTSNPVSVITGATLEQIYGLPQMRELALATFHEVLAVATAYDARLSMEPTTFMQFGASMGAIRTSMLQDFEKGLPLELAAIGDAVLEMAQKVNVPMPVTRSVVTLARFCAEHPHKDHVRH